MTRFSMRLRTRLVLMAAVAVLPAFVVMVYDQAQDRQRAREQTVDDALRLTQLAASRQASVFVGAERFLQTLGQFPGLESADPSECNRLMAVMRRDHPGYLNIAMMRADGTVTCSSSPATLSMKLGDRPWFQRALRARTPILGDYQVGRVTGAPDIVVAHPLVNNRDAVTHVLAVALELNQFSDLVSTTRLPRRATLTLFDRRRTILARYPDGDRWVGTEVPDNDSMQRLRAGARQDVAEQVGVDAIKRLYVTVPVETGFDAGLFVGVGIEREVAFAEVDRIFQRHMWLFGIVLLAVVAAALIGGHVFVVRPIKALKAVTKRLACGDLRARAEQAHGVHELLALGDAVNVMAVALETRQAQLLASEGRYRLLFERNPHPMWAYDIQTLRFVEVNDAAVQRYGYTRDEFLAMRITDIRPPEDAGRLLAALDDVSGAESWGRTSGWRHRLKSGQIIDVEITSHGLILDDKPVRLVLAQDVTERLRAESARDMAEERMRFALGASDVGIWEANLATGVSYWSEMCELMHGLAPGTFGNTVDAFMACIHREDREEARQAIARAMEERRDATIEYRTTWPDGTEHRISTTAHFSYDESGRPLRGAGITIDVTERRSLEDQLRQSQKMEAVGQLAGGIAHDFNNMLTAIIGNAEFVLDDLPDDDPRRGDVEEIGKAARRAATLTHQLLAFSRKQMLAPRVLRLGDVVGDVTPMLRRLLGETIDLRTSMGDRGHVRADAGQIEQVLMNLAVNARDAMPAGGRLTIETADVMLDEAFARHHPTVQAGPYVMVAVSDTGHGMDDATQKRIFEPFFTTKPRGQGTGLGLATVYGIVKQSGGSIWVTSQVEHGTTFTIYFPKTEGAAEAASAADLARRNMRGDETILLVEDEDIVREFAFKVLSRYGYTVHPIATPGRAIDFAAAHHGTIDVILSDVILPEMNGPAMVAQLQERHPESKTVYMSGYTDNAIVVDDVVRAKMSFLQKPFSSEALVGRIREVLDATSV